jgi:hypothetical protein
VGREPPGGWIAAAGATMERGDRCRAVEFRGASAGATREERALPEDRSDRKGLGAPGSACTVRVRFRCENGRRKREIGLEFGMKSRDYRWLRWSDPNHPPKSQDGVPAYARADSESGTWDLRSGAYFFVASTEIAIDSV